MKMHENLLKFESYIEKGLIRKVVSPCKKLVLYNYTDHCTYEKAWDEVTLNARGTVYEIATGKVIAKAFPKFFNYGELSEEKKAEVLNAENFEVFEKMDGSLGIVYYYDGEWRVNTRGSFTSDQAIKGKEMIDSNYNMPDHLQGCTLLVEIIYPENKIIVDYGQQEKLVILGSYGKQHEYLPYKYEETCMSHVPSVKFNTIEELQAHLVTLDHTEEGYVVRLENGYRVKFKSAEYLALARIMSNMSPLTFWERMENGVIDREFLETLPEEFRDECDKIADRLEKQYKHKGMKYAIEFKSYFISTNITRKEVALTCKEKGLNLPAMFAILDKKDDILDKIIKTEIRPTGNIIKE